MNRVRQAAITREIIEIVSGASALWKKGVRPRRFVSDKLQFVAYLVFTRVG